MFNWIKRITDDDSKKLDRYRAICAECLKLIDRDGTNNEDSYMALLDEIMKYGEGEIETPAWNHAINLSYRLDLTRRIRVRPDRD